jgi:hypothetical protein
MVFKDMDFNKINMHLDGVNGKLSDIDYYDTVLYGIIDVGLSVDVAAPAYFKNNKAISYVSKMLAPVDGSKKASSKGSIRDAYL